MSVSLWIYLIPAGLIVGFYLWKGRRRDNNSRRVLAESVASGMTEPASLHPLIDPARCLGCASCISACPENSVLGLLNGKAQLVNPSHCIGHGACKTACPFDAIELVFGTEKRGLDIPEVKPDYQTNVPGIFIAGELGGMGLIRNAVTQGVQAVASISKLSGIGKSHPLDLVIVGAGPAGIAASLAAKDKNLRFVTLEQDSLGGTVSHYPRGKIVMTAPVVLPIVGKMHFKETTKEALMSFWEGIIETAGLKINTRERVESVTQEKTGFTVKTSNNSYQARALLLAIGRRGTPRKLDVPGEEKSKVVYRLIDPEQYRNQQVLVVGGGDSALEAAISIAEEAGTQVTISYRNDAFSRAKEKNRSRLADAEKSGRLQVMLKSVVKQIGDNDVLIDAEGQLHKIGNDAVIVCAGGILPTPFLKEMGISVETKFGTA
jgi:thioredoxin reductase (NADPH)